MRKGASISYPYVSKTLDALLEGSGHSLQLEMRTGLHHVTLWRYLTRLCNRKLVATTRGKTENGHSVIVYSLTDSGREVQQLLRKTDEILNAL